MSDFAVEYGVLAEYGTTMGQRTQEASQLFSSARVDSPNTALAGGMAAFASRALQGRYEAATRRVTEHLREHPAKLVESANNYRGAEDTGVGRIREMFGG